MHLSSLREGILKDVDIIPCIYYDIPSDNSEQLDLPLSPFSRFYIKFTPLHPEDNPEVNLQTERERLKTFYTKIALPLKEVWSRKRITKITGYGRKILVKYELHFPLFRYHIVQNKPSYKTITDADFPSMNPNDVLTIVAHFQTLKIDDTSMGAYHASMNFLRDYVVEFCRCDYELASLNGTQDYVKKIEFVLPEADLLVEGPIDDPVLGFVYKPRSTNKKDFFRVQDKNLVPTKALNKFIGRASRSDAHVQVKDKFIN